MKKAVVGVIMVLFAGTTACGDEPLARESFVSQQTSLFGPSALTAAGASDSADNLTFERTESVRPFDRLLRLDPELPILSGDVFIGPNERGTIEDVVWVRLERVDETVAGAMGSLVLTAFDGGGPQMRVTRRSTRREADLEWFDGTRWRATGAVLDLDGDYRVRTVMDLDAGTMDVYLLRRGGGTETPVLLGETFRAFGANEVRRQFSLGRASGMKAGLAAWQLWRSGVVELLKTEVDDHHKAVSGSVTAMRYAADVRVTGDIVRAEGPDGSTGYSLRRARGFRDDVELADISGWRPQARVQRQTNFSRSGRWSLALSEGSEPIEQELTVPHADFEVKLSFLIPKELDTNRQVYLVRFKDLETRAEPVGPSVYIDYGAGGGGKSLLIFQLHPNEYRSEVVDVQPEKWYGLNLRTSRAHASYAAKFIDVDGTERDLNEGKPVPFFLGTDVGERLAWRLFTIVTMRPGQTELRNVEIVPQPRTIDLIWDEKIRKQLPGLRLRGLKDEQLKGMNLGDPQALWQAANGSAEIEKHWPALRITEADAEKLKEYRLLLIEGNLFFPWPVVEFAYNANGTLYFNAWWRSAGGVANASTDQWSPAGIDPKAGQQSLAAVQMLYLRPALDAKPQAEVHWVLPGCAFEQHAPIPRELFVGKDVTLERPAVEEPGSGAALVDGMLYIVEDRAAVGVYDMKMHRERYRPKPFGEILKNPYYEANGLVWDRWEGCWWMLSNSTRMVYRLDRDFRFVEPSMRWHLDKGVLSAAGPERLYFILPTGELLMTDKFLTVRRKMPIEKMFPDAPLFSAAEFAGGYLYLATRADSPVFPNSILCVDTEFWNPVFRIDVSESFPDVSAMTSDDEKMALLGKRRGIATFKLPAKEEIAPKTTFAYVDDLALVPIKSAEDIYLIPGPDGGLAGWERKEPLKPSSEGKGFILKTAATYAVYEKSPIAYVGPQQSQYSFLKLRTLEPKNRGTLLVDVRTKSGPLFRRLAILYGPRAIFDKRAPKYLGRTLDFASFASRADAQSTMSAQYLHQYANGPHHGIDLKCLRLLPIGEGHTEHVVSLLDDLDIAAGDSIDGIVLRSGGQCPPIVTLSLSASGEIGVDHADGAIASNPVEIEPARRRLAWVSWDQKPFDESQGALRFEVRTAADKYSIDDAAWVSVLNGAAANLPLERYLQWRAALSTSDPWRPPGLSGVTFGLGATDASDMIEKETSGRRWLLLLLVIPLAAAVAYFLIGRKSLWK